MVEIKLLLEKSKEIVKHVSNSLAKLHVNIRNQCKNFVQNLPNSFDVPEASQFMVAMENTLEYCEHSEAFHFETAYKNCGTNKCNSCGQVGEVYKTITINTTEQAIFFTTVIIS
jgi:hypothetical protein